MADKQTAPGKTMPDKGMGKMPEKGASGEKPIGKDAGKGGGTGKK